MSQGESLKETQEQPLGAATRTVPVWLASAETTVGVVAVTW